MPNKIKPKRSYTTNAVPTAADLEVNELAINWADGIAYTKNSSGQVVSFTLGGGGGSASGEDSVLRALFAPPAPTGLTATAGNAQVLLSWTAPTVLPQTPITAYEVQYSDDGGVTWTTHTESEGGSPQGWNISTATFSQSLSVGSQDSTPQDIAFSSDGAKMYIVGGAGVDINEFALATPWDISTASFAHSFSVASRDSTPTSVAFKADGSRMYVHGSENETVYEFSLSTPWDVSSASYSQEKDISAQESSGNAIAFSGDGTKLFVLGSAGDDVNEYDLATPWSVTTATFAQSFSVASQEATPHGLAFRPDGTQMYVTGSGSDSVHEYLLATGHDVSTASFVRSFSVAAKETAPYGIAFKADGLKMFVVGNTSDSVHEYALTAQ